MLGMFLTRLWNRWISLLIKNWRSEVPSAASSSQTQLTRKTIRQHSGAEVMFSFPVYLQFIQPLDPWGKVKFIDITCKWWLPVLQKTEELHQKTRKTKGTSHASVESQVSPKHGRGLHGSQTPLSPNGTAMHMAGAQHSCNHLPGGEGCTQPVRYHTPPWPDLLLLPSYFTSNKPELPGKCCCWAGPTHPVGGTNPLWDGTSLLWVNSVLAQIQNTKQSQVS